MQNFVILGELPTLNEIIDESKKHWSKYANPKKEYDGVVVAYAKKQLKPVKHYPVDIKVHWVCKNRRKDKDNISTGIKFILDGLVKAGILHSDGWGRINNISHFFSVDKANPRIIVTIKPCQV